MSEARDEFRTRNDQVVPILEAAVQNATTELRQGAMATAWFLIVEGMDSDGHRWLDWAYSPDIKSWQLKGYLKEALDMQLTGDVADEVKGE